MDSLAAAPAQHLQAPNPLPMKTEMDDSDRSIGALELDPSGRVCLVLPFFLFFRHTPDPIQNLALNAATRKVVRFTHNLARFVSHDWLQRAIERNH
jgi:hypothetical protein